MRYLIFMLIVITVSFNAYSADKTLKSVTSNRDSLMNRTYLAQKDKKGKWVLSCVSSDKQAEKLTEQMCSKKTDFELARLDSPALQASLPGTGRIIAFLTSVCCGCDTGEPYFMAIFDKMDLSGSLFAELTNDYSDAWYGIYGISATAARNGGNFLLIKSEGSDGGSGSERYDFLYLDKQFKTIGLADLMAAHDCDIASCHGEELSGKFITVNVFAAKKASYIYHGNEKKLMATKTEKIDLEDILLKKMQKQKAIQINRK